MEALLCRSELACRDVLVDSQFRKRGEDGMSPPIAEPDEALPFLEVFRKVLLGVFVESEVA